MSSASSSRAFDRSSPPFPDHPRVAIVGAGIGGLTLALALRERHIPCIVFEQAFRFEEEGAGLQLAPNGTRLLRQLGFEQALRRVAVQPQALQMLDGLTGRSLFRVRLGDEVERRFGAPLMTVRRHAFHAELLRTIDPRTVVMGATVTSARTGPSGITLSFRDGTTFDAAAALGADGIHSLVRRPLLVHSNPRPSGKAVYRGVTAPGHGREAVPAAIRIWTGPDRHCVAYPVTSDGAVSFAATVPSRERPGHVRLSSHDRDDLLLAYGDWAPELHKMFRAADTVRRWELYDLPTLDRCVARRVALIGDAAHAMLPFLAQGANCAIEDAFTLAACLAESWPHAVEQSLSRYETLRRPRAARLQAEARIRGARSAWRGPSTQQGSFDATSSYLNRQSWIFGYDAEVAVADAGGVAVA